MKEYGIFYGSATGVTADVAKRIAKELGVADGDVHNVANAAPSKLGDYKTLILGTSTWGNGELEDDWYDFVDGAQALDLKGHNMAVFGCGDESMTDTFCNGVGELYTRMLPTGVTPVGVFDADVYDFNNTEARIDGRIVGLLLDEVNHPELTDERIDMWATEVKNAVEATVNA